MNNVLASIMDNSTPKFTKQVVDGNAKDQLEFMPAYLDSIFRSSLKSLSPKVNLKYLGWRKCTPEEEFQKMVLTDNTKSQYDIASSDIYLVEYTFEFEGRQFSRYIYLPYANDANLIHISGTKYHIVPVLSDTVISPSHKELFVRLLKNKLIFKSHLRNFVKDGRKEPAHVVYTNIIENNKGTKEPADKMLTSLAVYILGKYGFKESIRKYANRDDVIVTDQDVTNLRDTYHVYESTKSKPKQLRGLGYLGHNLKILVPKDNPPNLFLENFIYGIIYTMDILPDDAIDCVNVINSGKLNDEILFWRLTLGKISYKATTSIMTMRDNIQEHYDTLEGYMDNLIQDKLAEKGVEIDNFFSLLALILGNFNTWLINSKEFNSDLSNRYIDFLYYLAYDIILGFNKVIIGINKRASKKDTVSLEEIQKLFGLELTSKKIFGLVKSSATNITMMLADSVGDIKYPKITSTLEDQSRGNGVRRGSKTQFPESTKTLKGQDLVLGSLLFLTKVAPSPRFKVNMFFNYDPKTGRPLIPEDIDNTVKKLDTLLRGKQVDIGDIEVFDIEDAND